MGGVGMSVQEQINKYIAEQPQPKSADMQAFHRLLAEISPDCRLWFLDGRDGEGKVVSNPNIGYGLHTIEYADGKTREFYRVGLSANKAGLSVYIMNTPDKHYLSQAYGEKLGKAKITGYCISFKSLSDINADTLHEIVANSMDKGSEHEFR
jgi:hypothetical protein